MYAKFKIFNEHSECVVTNICNDKTIKVCETESNWGASLFVVIIRLSKKAHKWLMLRNQKESAGVCHRSDTLSKIRINPW